MSFRVCQRGWEYAQIWGIDGEVGICCWAVPGFQKTLGKLTESTIEELWHSDTAKEFRESLTDGSYRFCLKDKCPWIANNELEAHMREYDTVLDYPRELALAYERNCNYDCTCCIDRNNEESHQSGAELKIEKIESELRKFIDKVTIIGANGRGELFVSPHIMKKLSEWKPTAPAKNVHVVLETNGVLFDQKHWSQIENLGQYDLKVAVTVMGFEEATYQFLSGCKSPVSKIEESLRFIRSLREKGIVNDYEIGTVVQERNFREMPVFTRRCIEEFGADRVRLRPYFPWGEKYSEKAKWVFDIRNPEHPYYPEYKNMLKDPVFQHPKVMIWSGELL